MNINKNTNFGNNENIVNPLIIANSIEMRSYQKNISESSRGKNTLVILPTALGKTVISALICSDILYNYKNKRVIVMAPTRPLVMQHATSFSSILKIPHDQKYVITGKIPPNNRHLVWANDQLRIIFATPEIVKNDVLEQRINLDDFGLMVFDEAHRAVKDYAYTLIAQEYVKKARYPLILATTASPGANKERIEELCKTLHIEHIEYRNEDDDDVKNYINPINIQWKFFDLPNDYSDIISLLKIILSEKLKRLIQTGVIKKNNIEYVFKKDLLDLGEQLRNSLQNTYSENKGYVYSAIVNQSIALSLMYCIELIESQGAFSLITFLARLDASEGKSHNILMKDYRMQKIKEIINRDMVEHPKLNYLLDLLKSNNKKIFEYMELDKNDSNSQILKSHMDKVLIFTHYRDTAKHIVKILSDNGIQSKRFVGQSSRDDDEGMNQDLQADVLNSFRNDEFKVLVATSIAEEGLDIPEVDLVIFYEPISSEIRYIQRRGRTGRKSTGSVIILAANNTVDIRLLHASKRKVEKMRLLLNSIKLVLKPVYRPSPPINRMSNEEIELLNKKMIKKNAYHNLDYDDDVNNEIKKSENDKLKIRIKDSKKMGFSYSERLRYKTADPSKEILQNFNRKVDTASRRIYNKILQSKSQISFNVLKESLALEEDIIKHALKKLQKKKLIKLYDNDSLISFNRENTSQETGKTYDIKVERLLSGKASVLVNDKWHARLNNYDYVGPAGILKKGSEFRAICEIYRNDNVLCIRIKQVIV